MKQNKSIIIGLWIDDEPSSSEIVCMLLEEKFSIKVEFAQTIETAIHKLKQKRYDFIILDMLIPFLISDSEKRIQFGGEYFLKKILRSEILEDTRNPILLNIPIIVTTAVSREHLGKYIDNTKIFYVSKLALASEMVRVIRTVTMKTIDDAEVV